MSAKVRQRNAANSADAGSLTVNERILKECHTLYADGENGLIRIAQNLDLTLLAPRKKVSVLLIGNHSAGKSSFINWYVEEHVQRTGVAIETQGFSFVTSGRKRESLTGNATLHLYPHFSALREIEGVTDYLQTEISTSKQKKFSLVTFVDTPGLVDGDMKYPFDVNRAIKWLGDVSDLIFVFFDPIGQALCKRTLNLVEELSATHADKMKFYLSKADEAGHESDRQRVMMQIVQELCKRPGLNNTGFDMPTIYIPNASKTSRCANQIEEVCQEIEKTINHTVQNTLNTLEKDCGHIERLIGERLERDRRSGQYNMKARMKSCLLTVVGVLLPVVLLLDLLVMTSSREVLHTLLGEVGTSTARYYFAPLHAAWLQVPEGMQLYLLGGTAVLTLVLLVAARLIDGSRNERLTRKQQRALLEDRDYVLKCVKSKKAALYEEYLRQSVADHDL